MSLKKIFLAMIFVTVFAKTNGQSIMHSYGGEIAVIYGTVKDNFGSSSFGMRQTSFCYFPRYNFIENDNSSISIGSPISLGIGIMTNSTTNDAGLSFAYELPIVVDYNFGCKSTLDNDKNFGGYFGAGFSYYKVSISGSSYSDYNGATYGPVLRAGMRFGSSNESWKGHGLTTGLFYKFGLDKDKLSTIGCHILIDL